MKKAYLDNAATTAVDPQVLAAMQPYFSQKYGNASEPHRWGQEARVALDQARDQVATFLGAKSGEIIFTAGATESINFAHKGLIEALFQKFSSSNFQFSRKLHIITSSIEHKAVLETCRHLEKRGWVQVTTLPVDKYGLVKAADVAKAIKPNTVLVSVMYVNNEVGTVQPVAAIGKLLKKLNQLRVMSHQPPVYFHTDATQAAQYLDCQVDQLGVDLLSLTGHKIYAPKGIGALYVRQGTPLVRQLDGGGQEFNTRAGTENVPYIVGLGAAIERVSRVDQDTKLTKIIKLRDKLIKGVLQIPGAVLTGHPIKRAPHIASFAFRGAEGEAILLYLSEKGIAAASGSACTSGQLQASHVLTAMGVKPELVHGSLRLSLGKDNTEAEVNYVLQTLPVVIKKLRAMAPK